jgi:hypothetical protein
MSEAGETEGRAKARRACRLAMLERPTPRRITMHGRDKEAAA